MTAPSDVPIARRAAATEPEGPDPAAGRTQPARAAARAHHPRRRIAVIGGACTAVAVAVTAALLPGELRGGGDGPDPAVPLRHGAAIVIPDNVDPGIPNDELERLEASTESTIAAGVEPDYAVVSNLDGYRTVDDQGHVTLTVPVEGECEILPSGIIGAPAPRPRTPRRIEPAEVPVPAWRDDAADVPHRRGRRRRSRVHES